MLVDVSYVAVMLRSLLLAKLIPLACA